MAHRLLHAGMAATVIRTFDDLQSAMRACEQLAAAGVPRERVTMQTLDDEAGPVEGNFVAGSGRADPSASPSRGLVIGERLEYEDNFANAVNRSTHVVVVTVSGEAERIRVSTMLDSLGGSDPDRALR
jgi:hypothetical protein